MSDFIVLKNKINSFNKKIYVSGDKSISIRWVLSLLYQMEFLKQKIY